MILSPPKALIFDFDGLIVDTETCIFECWADFYKQHGETLDLASYKDCVGSDFGQFDPGKELERRTGEHFVWEHEDLVRNQEIRRRLENQPERPGVLDFIQRAHAAGCPLAVASSSNREWVSGWLEKLDLLEFFVGLRTRDDVEQIKPAPDLFLAATEVVKTAPADCLVLEDSENGLKAAKAAGIPCVIVKNPITAGGDFSDALLEAECFTEHAFQAMFETV